MQPINVRISADGYIAVFAYRSLCFRTKKCIGGKSHWQAEVNLANTDLKHFLQQTGPFAALDYPPRNADHDAVALRGSPCRCTMSCHWFGLIWSLEDRARRSYGTHFFARLSLQAMNIARLHTFQDIPQSSYPWKCWGVGSLGRFLMDAAKVEMYTASAAATGHSRLSIGWRCSEKSVAEDNLWTRKIASLDSTTTVWWRSVVRDACWSC